MALRSLGRLKKGTAGEHVVFHVILHVPVEESREPRAGVGAAGEAVIGHVRCEAVMLGSAAEKTEPVAVERAEIEDEDEEPMSGRDEKRGEKSVADESEARPVAMFLAQFFVLFREDELKPVVVQVSRGALVINREDFPGIERIPGKLAEPEVPVLEG